MSAAPAPPAAAASSLCWNCQEPLQVGSVRCLFCGVQQEAAPTQFLVAPGAAGAPAGLPQPAAYAPTPTSASVGAPVAVAPRAQREYRPSGAVALGAPFDGSVASVGARIVAFTIDVIFVTAIVVTVLLVTRQVIYSGIAFVEVLVGLWVLEARTGATPGNALLRLRASRDDAPYSPGIGRSFVRTFITGAGWLVFGIGAWIVVASSGWDSARRGRSWADKAAHTLVVAVPRRQRTVVAPPVTFTAGPLPVGVVPVGGIAPAATALQAPPGVRIVQEQAPVALAAPQIISTALRPAMVDESSASASSTGVAANAFASAPVAVAQAPSTPISRSEAPATEAAGGTLLLVFDTGQREQLEIPVAVNLGRNPTVTEPTDKLITVTDPESTVSKTHLRLEHSRGTTWVTDGGSTNGTDLLSDEGDVTRLKAGERVLVDEGTRVRVGNRAFTISVILGEKS